MKVHWSPSDLLLHAVVAAPPLGGACPVVERGAVSKDTATRRIDLEIIMLRHCATVYIFINIYISGKNFDHCL